MSIDDERRSMYDMYGQLERRVDTNDKREESDVRLIAQRMQQMEAHLEATDKRVEALNKERDSLFRWGILALGSVVFALGSLLVSIFMGGRVK